MIIITIKVIITIKIIVILKSTKQSDVPEELAGAKLFAGRLHGTPEDCCL